MDEKTLKEIEQLDNTQVLDELEDLRVNNLYDDLQEMLYAIFPLYAIVYNEIVEKFRIIIPYENDGIATNANDELVYQLALQDDTGFVRTMMWNLDDPVDNAEFVRGGRKPLLPIVKKCNNFLEAVNALAEIQKDGDKLLKEV